MFAGDDQLGEVLVEDVAHYLDGQIRLGVQQFRSQGLGGVGLLFDAFPLRAQSVDIVGQFFLGRAFGSGAHDDARVLRQVVLQDLLQALALNVRQLAGDAGHRTAWHVDQVAAGQRDLAGQAGTLVTHWVLGDLDQYRVASLQRVLDAAWCAFQRSNIPVDFAGVQHGVAAASDIHESSFHRWQHVLDLADVHVADQRILLGLGNEVLSEHPIFQHTDLDAIFALAHNHLAFNGLAAGQELGLGDHLAATTGFARFAATLALGFQTGGAAHRSNLVVDRGMALDGATRCAHTGDGVRRIILRTAFKFQVHIATATAAATARSDIVLVGLRSGGGTASRFLLLGHGLCQHCLCSFRHGERIQDHGAAVFSQQLAGLIDDRCFFNLGGFRLDWSSGWRFGCSCSFFHSLLL